MSNKPEIELVDMRFTFKVGGRLYQCYHGADNYASIRLHGITIYHAAAMYKRPRTSRKMFIILLRQVSRGAAQIK